MLKLTLLLIDLLNAETLRLFVDICENVKRIVSIFLDISVRCPSNNTTKLCHFHPYNRLNDEVSSFEQSCCGKPIPDQEQSQSQIRNTNDFTMTYYGRR